MTDTMDNSFDENDTIDLTSVIAEFPLGDEYPNQNIPIKKLSSVFDNMISKQNSNIDENISNSSMKVFLRVRPIKSKDLISTVTIESDNSIITNAPESSKRAQYTKTESRHYVFTRVFGGNSTQDEVYEHTTYPLLQRFLGGDNCVMFAYGMTNAGKTYTIQGQNSNPGILPRLVTAVLEQLSSNKEEWDLHVSMLEIYQENIFDLLSKKKEKLSIRDANGKVEVNKLSTHSIKSAKDACKLMDQAASKRSKSSTFLNTGSSRSHAVYTITLDRCTSQDGVYNQSVAFQLVDLAGAERGNRTKATSAQQKEANNINMSLMQLWRCLQGMKKNNGNVSLNSTQEIIPFRESKLTHLLMPILNRAGMSGISMIACVNPQEADYDETISILGNASIASKIKEISDVGRTAAQHLKEKEYIPVVNAPIITNTSSHTTSAAVSAAAAIALKKRRLESTASTTTLNSTRSGRESICLKKAAAPNTTVVSITNNGASNKVRTSLSGMKRTSSMLSSETNDIDENNDESVAGTGSFSECKRLRLEIQLLKEQNAQMMFEQYTRETEIRVEVSEEMAIRSNHLLEQIQNLQSQLNTQTSQSIVMSSVTASVKKERKRQLQTIAENHTSKDIQEVEDELMRTRAIYEQEILTLKTQNESLVNIVKTLQAKIDPLGTTTISTSSKSNSICIDSLSNNILQSIDTSSAQVAAEFSNRLQRDQRFKKNDENNNLTNFIYPSDNLKKSPTRSPLSNLGNSPVQIRLMKGYQNNNMDTNNPITTSGTTTVLELKNNIQKMTNSFSDNTSRSLRSHIIRG